MIYKNAPIQEAVFDVRVDKINVDNGESLSFFGDILKESYPDEKKKNNFSGTIHFNSPSGPETRTQNKTIGYIYSTLDSTRQIQIRLDGFTFNVLRPYENWEIHFDEFIKNWELYNSKLKPSNILRIAARYINRIEIPTPVTDFQEYITNIPPIPKCLPQTLSNFFMQTQIPCEEELKIVTLTETIEQIKENSLFFILDIDVGQQMGIENNTCSLVKIFNEIRDLKNKIFETCITEKTRKLFI